MNIKIDLSKCHGCGFCIDKCSGSAFTLKVIKYKAVWDERGCIDCMACTEPGFCPSGAVEVECE